MATNTYMQEHQQRAWLVRRSIDACSVPETDLNVSPLQAQLLALRGIHEPEQVHAFIHARLKDLPDPFLLPDMQVAVERLGKAIRSREVIAVHGDYDVDGISATALVFSALQHFGAEVRYHIPLRLQDGYGLSSAALHADAADGVRVIVSVDCGISALDEARTAAELGLDLIITDHHQPGEELPVAHACINPWLDHSHYPYAPLCGVGVAFMLVVALQAHLRRNNLLDTTSFDVRTLLDFVTLGTIADLVPLTGVNRMLVRTGLPLLQGDFRPGISSLNKVAGISSVSAGSVGFKLAPRLNAAGRLEDASLGVELLLSTDATRAHELATLLDQCNAERQHLESTALEQARARVCTELAAEQRTIVLADARWHPGVIGIVASRLVELFHRPVVLLAIDESTGTAKGSGRSIKGFNLYQALQQCAHCLNGYGGHEFAAGLSLETSAIETFAMSMEDYALEVLDPDDLMPRHVYDLELSLDEINAHLYQEIQQLAPFGMGNPEPVFLCREVKPQQVEIVKEKHLRFRVQQGGYSMPCIGFGMAGLKELLDEHVDILFQVDMNAWRGRTNLQFRVKAVRPAC